MQLGERTGRLLGWAGLAAGIEPERTDDAGRFCASSLLAVGPAKFLGDISYSLYLWHWPVVVFYVFHLGRTPSFLHGSVIALIILASAIASYYLVEQRFRVPLRHPLGSPAGGPTGRSRNRGAFVLGSGPVAAVFLAAVAPWGIVEAKPQQLDGALNLRQYPGAMALDRDRPAAVPSGSHCGRTRPWR
ncbi:hypothetical protein QK290_00860 [Pseudarthrobacter sp. AL07]|uniref:acyltransferase family protein n=1 Tax=unclassified Pseudarthrobacter TaxID=2647000 RepID=UPI00249CA30C|nr:MULTISPECIES: hypothetical protein [unclassified Pseudarthrobacter]MDI3193079.1 hypothetical protein [Pseudarthrobacter sp. AL20]MDI3207101.1 hypothetical protein [Pseudarthrobacter sp. AL07]